MVAGLNPNNVASFKAFTAVFSLERMMLHSNMIQETGVDTWPVVLKVNLHSLAVAFLIFFSHFSPIYGPFQEEKYVSSIMWKMTFERPLRDNT